MDFDALTSGVILAALTGLTYLAYRHYDAYLKIVLPLSYVLALASMGCFAFMLGVSVTHQELSVFIPDKFSARASAIAYGLTLDWRVLVLMGGTSLYTVFLGFLPYLIRNMSKKDDVQDKRD